MYLSHLSHCQVWFTEGSTHVSTSIHQQTDQISRYVKQNLKSPEVLELNSAVNSRFRQLADGWFGDVFYPWCQGSRPPKCHPQWLDDKLSRSFKIQGFLWISQLYFIIVHHCSWKYETLITFGAHSLLPGFLSLGVPFNHRHETSEAGSCRQLSGMPRHDWLARGVRCCIWVKQLWSMV
jgi:hypothetical protein